MIRLGSPWFLLLALVVVARVLLFARDRRSGFAAFGFSSLDRMFDFSVRSGSIAVHRPLKQMTLDVDRIDDFVRYLKDHYRDRAVLKYVDITPIWHADGVETFTLSRGDFTNLEQALDQIVKLIG